MTSRSKEKNPLLSAALAYAERGWFVFPLIPRTKRPITENGVLDASNNHHQVLEWWQAFPAANIAFQTGELFDVLDIDGNQSVPALLEILGRDYRHSGPVVSTGKGKHLYFAHLEGSRNRAGLLGGKLDYRGSGGYVVAPPSIHPSGRIYQWDENRDYRADLPELPQTLVTIIKPPIANTAPQVAINRGGLTAHDASLLMTAKGDLINRRPPIIEVATALGLLVKPMGSHFVTNCIFHNDPGPSMVLYIQQDKFHCYGCEAHGDSFDLQARVDMTGRRAL